MQEEEQGGDGGGEGGEDEGGRFVIFGKSKPKIGRFCLMPSTGKPAIVQMMNLIAEQVGMVRGKSSSG